MKKLLLIGTTLLLPIGQINAYEGMYTGGPGPSQPIGKNLKKQSKRDWLHEDTGCGLDCPQPSPAATPGFPNVPGFSFKLLTMTHAEGNVVPAQVKTELFGVYKTLQECDMARAHKIAELDAVGDRQRHYPSGSKPGTTWTTDWVTGPNGDMHGTTTKTLSTPPAQYLNVASCESGVFSPGPEDPNIISPPPQRKPTHTPQRRTENK